MNLGGSRASCAGRGPRTLLARLFAAMRLAAALLTGLLLYQAGAVLAQQEAESMRVENLTREFTDPLTTLPQLFLRDVYTPTNYGTRAQANKVILQAIVPRIPKVSLFPAVQLVRPTFQLVTVPTGNGRETRTEFGDMMFFDFVVLPWPRWGTGWLVALGPVFVFPTATHALAGQGSWQVGPGFGTIYKRIPGVLLGCLIQNPVSFAYTSGSRPPLSTLAVQPIFAMYLGWGFYLRSADATWTMGWHRGSATVLPLSVAIGKIIVHDGYPPIHFFVGGEWTAYRQFAPVAPQTTIRFGMTVAFPGWRPWR